MIAQLCNTDETDGWEPIPPADLDAAPCDDLPEAAPVAPEAPPSAPMLEPLPVDWYEMEIPPRRFVFTGRVPLDCVTLLAAAGGTGKSTLALELAASAATGRELLPAFRPERGPSRVAVVSCEDDSAELMRRLKRIVKAFRLDFDRADLDLMADNLRVFAPPTFCAIEQAPDGTLCASADLRRLAVELADFRPVMVIVDPLAAILGGLAEENSNEVAQRVSGLLRAAVPPGSALLINTHCAKVDRASGATPRGAGAWSDAARQVIGMRPPDEKEARVLGDDAIRAVVLSVVKSNYSALSGPVYLMKSADPEHAGVLRQFSFRDYESNADRAKHAQVAGHVLAALKRCPVTLQEARGYGDADAKARGEEFRDTLTARLGRSLSRNDLGALLRDMMDRREVITSMNGKRPVLIPNSEPENEDDRLN